MQKVGIVMSTLTCLTQVAAAVEPVSVVFKAKGSFEEVRDMLQASIEGKGLKINHVNHIASMLARTGQDLGETTMPIVAGEQFEFCSAMLSRQMMAADPNAITLCPYAISVYMVPGDPVVYMAYRKMPTTKKPVLKKSFKAVERLLTEIIQEAQ